MSILIYPHVIQKLIYLVMMTIPKKLLPLNDSVGSSSSQRKEINMSTSSLFRGILK